MGSGKGRSESPKARRELELGRRAFFDPSAIIEQDRIEGHEPRWQTLGMAGGVLLLLVAHTVREGEDAVEIVRIISARRAMKAERRRYEEEIR